MPATIPRNEELAKKARQLYVPRVFGYRSVAKELGVGRTTVRHWVDPGFAERQRIASLQAKRRRTGVCQRCGGETRYNGRTVNGASLLCDSCNHEPFTHCSNGHELTPEIDLRQKYKGAICRICRNAYMREYSARRRRDAGVRERGPYSHPLEEQLLAGLKKDEG